MNGQQVGNSKRDPTTTVAFTNPATASAHPTNHRTTTQSVVAMSRIVWDWVVPWLIPRHHRRHLPLSRNQWPALRDKHAARLCAVAEGLFPLVSRVCSSLVSHYDSHYQVLDAAAEAGATSCISWLIKSHNTGGGRDTSGDMNSTGATADGRERGEGCDGEERVAVLRRMRRRAEKEFIHVLGGLCFGGHLAVAQKLVDGHFPGIVWPGCGDRGESSSSAVALEVKLSDYIRSSDLLARVCERGHSDLVKWMVDQFNIREPWEFVQPFAKALAGGHLDLAKWMFNTFNLLQVLSNWDAFGTLEIHQNACYSGNLDVLKWCLEIFPLEDEEDMARDLLASCLRGTNSVDVCQYLKDHLPVPFLLSSLFKTIRRLDALKWAISSFPSLFSTPRTLEDLEALCATPDGLKYAVEELPPSTSLLRVVCRMKKGNNTPVVKLLSSRMTLSQEDVSEAFCTSLANNNVSIASWLDETFHILNTSSRSTSVGSILVEMCKAISSPGGDFSSREGLEWLVNNPSMRGVEERFVVEAIEELVSRGMSNVPLLMIERFPISEPKRSELLVSVLTESIKSYTITQVKKVISTGNFTKESVAMCLANPTCAQSTKVVKWLASHFQLGHEHTTAENNSLMCNLLIWGQGTCAEWLINKFHITLTEFSGFSSLETPSFLETDLATWKTFLEVFQGITTTLIKKNFFLQFVCQSPIIAQYTMRLFPYLTMHDIVKFCSEAPKYNFSLETIFWLKQSHPNIWASH
ncbi:hypothetical protein Pelo_2945 [Pelomyxa schiedti]|nr:hypothetical protein Pelo_2945 [Pelomyxa schiedti]